ncbi:MAG: DUF167 domain-containing protein [Alphaproteobacteria bacterium]|nr:MAG: DUF167 domain-containing protein [Alphaproteobacteria bacterium]
MAPPRSVSVSARVTGDGKCVLVPVRLTPKAGRNRIVGVRADADGTRRLAVSVTAVAEDGKANGALIALLAKTWKLPKSAIAITAGAKARSKTVRVAGDPAQILQRVHRHGCQA